MRSLSLGHARSCWRAGAKPTAAYGVLSDCSVLVDSAALLASRAATHAPRLGANPPLGAIRSLCSVLSVRQGFRASRATHARDLARLISRTIPSLLLGTCPFGHCFRASRGAEHTATSHNWRPCSTLSLAVSSGAVDSHAFGINARGQITGFVYVSGNYSAFVSARGLHVSRGQSPVERSPERSASTNRGRITGVSSGPAAAALPVRAAPVRAALRAGARSDCSDESQTSPR